MTRHDKHPLSDVPKAILTILATALAVQLGIGMLQPAPVARASDLRAPPPLLALQLAAFGDPVPVAKMVMLHIQAFDMQAANTIRYQALNYDNLTAWLSAVLSLDPRGQYPLHAATRVYADVADETRQRKMLDFVYAEFFADPNRRWPWLAEAAAIAKHRLKDLPLAQRYAAAVQQYATGEQVPLWARQMEAFILEDMNELEAARIMIGGFIASGRVLEPGELRFLEERLKQIETRLEAPGRN